MKNILISVLIIVLFGSIFASSISAQENGINKWVVCKLFADGSTVDIGSLAEGGELTISHPNKDFQLVFVPLHYLGGKLELNMEKVSLCSSTSELIVSGYYLTVGENILSLRNGDKVVKAKIYFGSEPAIWPIQL